MEKALAERIYSVPCMQLKLNYKQSESEILRAIHPPSSLRMFLQWSLSLLVLLATYTLQCVALQGKLAECEVERLFVHKFTTLYHLEGRQHSFPGFVIHFIAYK